MIAQLAGGLVTAGSAGGWLSDSCSSRDRASQNDRKIDRMSKTLLILLGLSLGFNVYQWDLYRPWHGTAGFERMTDQQTLFRDSHRWRMHHRDFSYTVDNAPSLEAAQAELVKVMVQEYGYRLPHWWELSRWYENLTPDFRDEVEQAEARR
jgi:hypothetical protein